MKIFEEFQVSIGFSSTNFNILYDHIFLNYWRNLREKFDKIL